MPRGRKNKKTGLTTPLTHTHTRTHARHTHTRATRTHTPVRQRGVDGELHDVAQAPRYRVPEVLGRAEAAEGHGGRAGDAEGDLLHAGQAGDGAEGVALEVEEGRE